MHLVQGLIFLGCQPKVKMVLVYSFYSTFYPIHKNLDLEKDPKFNFDYENDKQMPFIFYIYIIQASKHRLNLDPGLIIYVFDSPVSMAMIGT